MRTRVRYIGRVQGVGFRATVRDFAHSLGVVGWVRNEPDGSVLMEAQGDPNQLETLLARIRSRMLANITAMDRSMLVDVDADTNADFRIDR